MLTTATPRRDRDKSYILFIFWDSQRALLLGALVGVTVPALPRTRDSPPVYDATQWSVDD